MSDKVTVIGNYVREILKELKVTTVFAICCCKIMIKWSIDPVGLIHVLPMPRCIQFSYYACNNLEGPALSDLKI